MAETTPPAHWRRRTVVVSMAVVAVLAAHAAAWWWVTGRIEAAWPDSVAVAKSWGWDVSSGPPLRAGWPWTASVRRPDVVATRPLGDATLRVRFEQLEFGVSPADLHALHAEAFGLATVSVGDGPPLSLRAASAVLRVPSDGAASLAVRGLEAAAPERRGLTVSDLDVLLDGTSASLSASGVQARPPLPQPFDAGGRVSFRFSVTPAFPFAATPGGAAALWHAAGGKAVMPELAVRWGPLAIDGHAEGGLDAALQPQVQGVLDTQGLTTLLDATAEAGVLAKPVAQAARAVLGILALSSAGGAVRVPFTLSDGTLTVARFPLASFPRLEWDPP